jgi:hypothetical protein
MRLSLLRRTSSWLNGLLASPELIDNDDLGEEDGSLRPGAAVIKLFSFVTDDEAQ